MGDGLKRATLATIRTRTYATVDYKGNPVTLTGDQVVALYEAIKRMDAEPFRAVGADRGSDRRHDRAVQILRKAGLVTFDRPSRTWVVT